VSRITNILEKLTWNGLATSCEKRLDFHFLFIFAGCESVKKCARRLNAQIAPLPPRAADQ
jgi:hypothetical protein